MSEYEVFEDPYCYKGTTVLKNKAKLRNPEHLQDFELEISTLRGLEPLPRGSFDPAHYCAVHRHLFQDVYAWAGRYRTIRTGKGGNWFCYPEHIEREIKKLFKQLHAAAFTPGAAKADFIAAAADFLAELNVIHCFREGNGRAQLSFMYLVAARAGRALKLARISEDAFLSAMIESFSGSLKPLERQLKSLTD